MITQAEKHMNPYILPGTSDRQSPQYFMKVAANTYRISVVSMKGKSRFKKIVEGRFYAMWLIRKHTEISTTNIGRLFNRDHATVLYAVRTIDTRMELNQLLVEL